MNSLVSNNTFSGWETILKIDFIKGITGSYTYATSQEFHKSTTDAFNMYDGDSYGGNIRDNISENFDLIFLNPGAGNYHLSPLSSCVNNGMDVRGYIFSGIVMDFDGEERPAKIGNMRPNFDIGADEFYEE